jgi:predicted metal-dependent hydrolase
MDRLTKDRLFQKGLEAFNTEHFYDAHEYWEEVWLETQNPEKMFLQGLIQVAAAFHHYSRANSLGCRNLLQAGLLKLECFPEEYWGFAIEPLRASVRQWLVLLRAGENPMQLEIPRIRSRGGRPACFRMPPELK